MRIQPSHIRCHLPIVSDRQKFSLLDHARIFRVSLEPVIREIFARGREGKTFGDPKRLEDDILYGSVESSFPGASPTFLNLTRAFLTFWKEYKDIAHAEPCVALQVLLLGFINEHKKRFFPASNLRTPVSYMVFAGPQREALSAFGDG